MYHWRMVIELPKQHGGVFRQPRCFPSGFILKIEALNVPVGTVSRLLYIVAFDSLQKNKKYNPVQIIQLMFFA